MGESEVTRAHWEGAGFEPPVFVHPAEQAPATCLDPRCPVENVSFFGALRYVNRLSEQAGLAPCYELSDCTGQVGSNLQCKSALLTAPSAYECEGYRLPMEAEWEYATRAGTTTAYYSGDILVAGGCLEDANLNPIAWYCVNSGDVVHPVKQKRPNAWGLYDVSGNVYEFCNDLKWGLGYGEGPLTDPPGVLTPGRELVDPDHRRVTRGGAAFSHPDGCKASRRLDYARIGNWLGFRIARTVPADER
jgi:formylglycine-generating enzyme required for sulfatase activity